MGKAVPYRVYDLAANEGGVSVGDDANTAFAVASLEQWRQRMGPSATPRPPSVLNGAKEVSGGAGPHERALRPGALASRAIGKDPDLLLELDELVSPETRGDYCRRCRWTLKRPTDSAVYTMRHYPS